jgi:hypothetical protein
MAALDGKQVQKQWLEHFEDLTDPKSNEIFENIEYSTIVFGNVFNKHETILTVKFLKSLLYIILKFRTNTAA